MSAIAQSGSAAEVAASRSRSWPLALRLARRELRGGLKGFRIFLACLTLGVTAIAGVGSVSESMLAGLKRDGRVLLGGDVDLRLIHQAASPEQLAFLESRAEVSRVAEMRAMARGQAEGARRVLVELRAVDRLYPLFGAAEISPAPGAPADLTEALARRGIRLPGCTSPVSSRLAWATMKVGPRVKAREVRSGSCSSTPAMR